jgi:hypothetical protein
MATTKITFTGVKDVEELNNPYLDEDLSTIVAAMLREALELGLATKGSPTPAAQLPSPQN